MGNWSPSSGINYNRNSSWEKVHVEQSLRNRSLRVVTLLVSFPLAVSESKTRSARFGIASHSARRNTAERKGKKFEEDMQRNPIWNEVETRSPTMRTHYASQSEGPTTRRRRHHRAAPPRRLNWRLCCGPRSSSLSFPRFFSISGFSNRRPIFRTQLRIRSCGDSSRRRRRRRRRRRQASDGGGGGFVAVFAL